LMEQDTKSIADVVVHNCMADYPKEEAVMFNPMGMAIFDIATGKYYLKKAMEMGLGQELE
jgi:ornithine cyclodeaminase/alanine dehydrogenase-like protein (mu-crystallin family)